MLSRLDETQIARISAMLFASAAEGLAVVDRSGHIVLGNPRLADMFGYPQGQLLGKPIEVLLPDGMRRAHEIHRKAYMHDPKARSMGQGLDLLGRRMNGSLFPLEVSLNHFEFDGAFYVMALITDISQRRRAEIELARINSELEERVEARTAQLRQAESDVRHALEVEKELNAMKSRFVSMASHEFRTPLSTIMSSVDLIARYNTGPDKEKVSRHVDRIRSKVRDLTQMLSEFLSLDKLEQGMIVCHPVETDIVHLAIELVEELRPLCKPGQEIQYDHIGDERTVVQDKQMLATALRNLLGNAIKYSPEGRRVDLVTAIEGDTLRITVRDQGMGIPLEDQPHIMERFFRASNAFTVQGTGLGLNITARFIEMMGGHIRFSSRPGEGTTFFVDVKRTHEQPEDHTAHRG
jgi:PAS domain S-box-containing protein